MEDKFRFGPKQKVFNWNMRAAREGLGLSQRDLDQLAGVKPNSISHYETLRSFPKPEIQEKIAKVLQVAKESIFSEWLKEFRIKKVPVAAAEKSISLGEVISLKLIAPEMLMIEGPEARIEKQIDGDLLRDKIRKILSDLTPRQQRVLILRFGLENGQERTLDEVALEFGLSGERIRQIEGEALRRLRHPSRSRQLKPFLTDAKV